LPIDRDKVQKQAEKLVASGKVEAGIQQYNLLVQDNPRDLGTLNKIGDLYVRLGKKGEAIKSYGRIAEIYAGDGFFLKAIAIYKKITKIDPAHLETLHSLADLYSKQGLKTEARAQYLVVAEALLKAGQAQKAIAAYEALASLDPDNAAHRLHVAELKLKCGLMAEAAQAFLDLARELESRGNARESAQVYERALKAGRGDARVAEGLCAALRRSGQHAKAVQIADEILASNPGNAPLLQSKGESLEALGRAEEAEACLRESLRRDPKRPETMLALARVLAGRGATAEAHPVVSGGLDPIMGAGKGAEAAKVLEAILARDPENRAVLEDLYRVHTMLGSKGGMIAAGEKLAEVSAREGRLHEALAVARRLAEIDPMATRHRQRLERLKALEREARGPGRLPPPRRRPRRASWRRPRWRSAPPARRGRRRRPRRSPRSSTWRRRRPRGSPRGRWPARSPRLAASWSPSCRPRTMTSSAST
jgi:tetratricopeptide (TPR) repeat protein